MSETVELVRKLVSVDEVRISEHGYDELSKDGILVVDVLDGLAEAIVVEDYPTAEEGRAFCSCRWMAKAARSMSYGVFRPGSGRQPFW